MRLMVRLSLMAASLTLASLTHRSRDEAGKASERGANGVGQRQLRRPPTPCLALASPRHYPARSLRELQVDAEHRYELEALSGMLLEAKSESLLSHADAVPQRAMANVDLQMLPSCI